MQRAAPALAIAVLAASTGAQELPRWGAPARDCLGGDGQGFVTFQAVLAGGAGRFHVHRADGSIEVCDWRDGRISRRRVEAEGLRPQPDERAFFLDRHCADARQATDGEGRILGWFAYPACRP